MLTHVTMRDFREAGIAEAYNMEEYTDLSSDLLGEAMNTADDFMSIYTSMVEAVTIEEELDMLYAFTRGFIDGARHIALRPTHPAITLDKRDGHMLIHGYDREQEKIVERLLSI